MRDSIYSASVRVHLGMCAIIAVSWCSEINHMKKWSVVTPASKWGEGGKGVEDKYFQRIYHFMIKLTIGLILTHAKLFGGDWGQENIYILGGENAPHVHHRISTLEKNKKRKVHCTLFCSMLWLFQQMMWVTSFTESNSFHFFRRLTFTIQA